MEKEMLFGNAARKVLKGFHLTFVTFTGGGLFSMVVLMLLKRMMNLDETTTLLDFSIFKLFTYTVNYGFFALITTSVVYALFTQWGFFRYYWITVKWVVLGGLFVLSWFWLGPSINGMASLSDAGFHTTVSQTGYLRFVDRSLFFTIVEFSAVIFILFLSTIRPWGAWRHKGPSNRKVLVIIVCGVAVIVIGLFVSSSISLQKYRKMHIEDSDLSAVPDGTYHGEAEVGGFVYKVEVEVFAHRITNVRTVDNRTSAYAFYAEGVFNKIIRDQNAHTDGVTGATTTSKALMKAVEIALENAAVQ
jgi:uncharacterized protein with FMN-binding domain